MPGEFALIERIRARVRARADVVLGIGDDAAILRIAPGHELVVSCDTLVSGVHFPAETAPAAAAPYLSPPSFLPPSAPPRRGASRPYQWSRGQTNRQPDIQNDAEHNIRTIYNLI